MARATRRLERRIFLKALALGLSIPAGVRLARVATAETTAPPKRFFLLYMPHGVAPEHYNPKVAGSDLSSFDLDQTNLSILGPLQAYKQYVNVYEGFQYVGEALAHTGVVNCLSGAATTDTTTPRTSFEHVIAQALGVTPLILGACSHMPYALDQNGMLFWDGTPVDPEKNPVKVADALFGSAAPRVNADLQLRQDLLTLTASEVRDLSSELSGLTSEQSKLQTHLSSIQTLQADMPTEASAPRPASCVAKPSLPTVEAVRADSAGRVGDPSHSDEYFYGEANFPLLFQAQLELVTQALICNAAQVVALMPLYPTCDFDFSFAGSPGSHHSALSHTSPALQGAGSGISIDNFDPQKRAPFARAQRWFCQQLVERVVSVLAATDDPFAPGSTVLDNAVIYWMSEIGDGYDHTRLSEIELAQVPSSLPLVTIGRCGGAIRSGQVVRAPLGAPADGPPPLASVVNRPATDIYLTLASAMGASNATFPDTTGPIREVLT